MNQNRKKHREIFIKTCEELLDVFVIKNELNEVNEHFNRAKSEKIDKDICCATRKASKEVEGSIKGIESKNKRES